MSRNINTKRRRKNKHNVSLTFLGVFPAYKSRNLYYIYKKTLLFNRNPRQTFKYVFNNTIISFTSNQTFHVKIRNRLLPISRYTIYWSSSRLIQNSILFKNYYHDIPNPLNSQLYNNNNLLPEIFSSKPPNISKYRNPSNKMETN